MKQHAGAKVHVRNQETASITSISSVVEAVIERAASTSGFGLARHSSPSARLSIVHDDEFKLVVNPSLVLMILQNVFLQVAMFSIVSTSASYTEHLGGTATFSGLAIGIPTAVSGPALVPVMVYDKGNYAPALHFTCFCMVTGSVLYALAYRFSFLYLILIGRMIQGCGFIGYLYTKRYCTDFRIVGIRPRTTLAGWLVLGQGVGMSAGPFIGGMLYKVGFSGVRSSIWNGYTAVGWVMATMWAVYWIVCCIWFEDVLQRETVVELFQLPSSFSHSLSRAPSKSEKKGFLQQVGDLGLGPG